MKNFIGAIVTLFYLITYKFWGPWNSSIDLLFSGLMLLLIGIPHGAGDHLVAKNIAERQHLTFHLKPFILFYLGIMSCYAFLWYSLPTIAFIIFIGISIFHFGDMEDVHPIDSKNKYINTIRSFILGSGILTTILFSHWDEAKTIIIEMNVSVPKNIPPSAIYLSLTLVFLGFEKKNYAQFLNTLLTITAGFFLPLIPAFICYFSGCHAINSFRGMKNRLNIKFFDLYKKLFPFTLGAIILGFIYIKLITKDLQLYPLFIFLSLLTLPHFLLMHKLIKRP